MLNEFLIKDDVHRENVLIAWFKKCFSFNASFTCKEKYLLGVKKKKCHL